eukprot:8829584-Karenia_brevis.AAC.1
MWVPTSFPEYHAGAIADCVTYQPRNGQRAVCIDYFFCNSMVEIIPYTAQVDMEFDMLGNADDHFPLKCRARLP